MNPEPCSSWASPYDDRATAMPSSRIWLGLLTKRRRMNWATKLRISPTITPLPMLLRKLCNAGSRAAGSPPPWGCSQPALARLTTSIRNTIASGSFREASISTSACSRWGRCSPARRSTSRVAIASVQETQAAAISATGTGSATTPSAGHSAATAAWMPHSSGVNTRVVSSTPPTASSTP